jgi:hypothetical protein
MPFAFDTDAGGEGKKLAPRLKLKKDAVFSMRTKKH